MTAKHVPATATHTDMVVGWMQDAAFRAVYERLEREEGPMLDASLNDFEEERQPPHPKGWGLKPKGAKPG
ncbi:MAG: hypothetical protein PHU77_05220 [Simplicispira sp.]|nr:hypothetical protein [Simplicispira sp.]